MSVAHLMGYVTWMIIAPLVSSCLRSTFVRNLLDVVKAWARAGDNLTGDDPHIRRDCLPFSRFNTRRFQSHVLKCETMLGTTAQITTLTAVEVLHTFGKSSAE
jgi:hypothetical protein